MQGLTNWDSFVNLKTLFHQLKIDMPYIIITIIISSITRRYGPLCGPTSSSCGGLRPSAKAFVALWAKKESLSDVLAHF